MKIILLVLIFFLKNTVVFAHSPVKSIIPNLSIDQNLGLKRLKKSIKIEILCVLLIFFLTSLLTTSLILPMGT
jgi:hypothetical protein